MRSKLEVEVLLRAVGDAAVASRAMTLGVLEARATAALAGLAEAIGADRACLCYTTAGPCADRFERFVSGGRPEVAAIGPALSAVAVNSVAEWSTATMPGPLPREQLGPALAGALAGTAVSWLLSTVLREVDTLVGVLTVAGCGAPPDDDDDLRPVLTAMGELMHSVVRRAGELSTSVPTPAQARLALDLVEEGVMFLDPQGRTVALNRAAYDQLGCAPGELDPDAPVWEQLDVRFLDGATVIPSAATGWFDRVGVLGPVPIRVVNRRGLVVSGQLTVRAVELEGREAGPEMLVVFSPSPGIATTPAPATIQAVLQRADELFDELQRAMTGAIRPTGPSLPPTLADVGLSARERDVVVLLLEGHRVSTIAQRLFLSPHTVRNHLKAIFRKTKVGSQAALIELARSGAWV